MNTVQACEILEVPLGSTAEDVDKSFRKLAAKYHPDKNNGNIDSENKFKQISEAYQFLKKHGTSSSNFGFNHINMNRDSFNNIDNIINDFFKQQRHPFTKVSEVNKGTINISFSESISGCEKDVVVNRLEKCDVCNSVNTDTSCKACLGTGVLRNSKTYYVHIPPGLNSNSSIRIKEGADYKNGFYSDALIEILIEKDPDMEKAGVDVISYITISLLNALKGISVDVRTVYGNKTLKIKPGIKHGECIRVSGYGVGKKGYHIFEVHVDYPENIDQLIKYLEDNSKKLEEIEGE